MLNHAFGCKPLAIFLGSTRTTTERVAWYIDELIVLDVSRNRRDQIQFLDILQETCELLFCSNSRWWRHRQC